MSQNSIDTKISKPAKSLSRVAAKIEQDIRQRGLSPGDRYMTAKEAADLLGLSPATCHRAMRLLAERDVLNRRPNSGTFVGQNLQVQPSNLVRSIYVLLSSDRRLGALSREAIMEGLWRELPGVGLHFSVLPLGNEVRYADELLSNAHKSGELLGIIAVSCPRQVYSFLAQQSAPVVIIGSVDRADEKLASVDCDQQQAGRLLAQHMLRRGYQHFAVLLGELWRPGDNLFLSGVQGELHGAGLPVGGLRVLSLPHDRRVFDLQVLPLLAESDQPLAIICQDVTFMPWLDEMRATLQEFKRKNIGISFNVDMAAADSRSSEYPCTYQKLSALDMSTLAAKLLSQLSAGETVPQRHQLLEMGLHDPAARSSSDPGAAPPKKDVS